MMDIPMTIGAVTAEGADRPAAALEAARTPPLLPQPRNGPWIGMLIVPRLQRKVKAALLGIDR